MNGILIADGKIGYRDIPKVACTSIKRELYRLEYGEVFDPKIVGMHVHNVFNSSEKTKNIDGAKFKFLVVRDPVARFLSAYSNRVMYHKELSRSYLVKKPEIMSKLPVLNPGIGQFIDNLESYLKVWTIAHHFSPMSTFLGKNDLSYFDKVYRVEDLSELESDLSNLLSTTVEFGRHQTGGKKYSVKDLSQAQLDRLIKFYKQDYELLTGRYTPEQVYKKWNSEDLV